MRLDRCLVPVFVLLCACGAETPDDQQQQTLLSSIASADDGVVRVELLAAAALHVGRNVVHYRIADKASAAIVRDAAVTHRPMMYMTSHNHTCGHVQPTAPAAGSDDYVGEIVFNMASGADGYWDVTVTVTRPGDSARAIVLSKVPVAESNLRKDLLVGPAGPTQEKLLFTLNWEKAPAVGLNEFVLTAHRRETMESFPALTDLAIAVTPQMPTMGHGSTGNVDPVHEANGNYRGKVNLTMGGLWTLDFAISRGGAALGTIQYELNL